MSDVPSKLSNHRVPAEEPSADQPARCVGLIGLGLMGTALADLLLRADFQVCGWDLESGPRDRLSRQGGMVGSSAADVAARCQTMLLSLPDGGVVGKVLLDCMETLRSGQTLIDTTTASPDQMRSHQSYLQPYHIEYVEAAVAGSSELLQAGGATLFLGCSPSLWERLQPLLKVLSNNVLHAGPVGAAAEFKLVHNLVLGLNRAVLSEGLVFAEAMGIDTRRALDLLKSTPAYSRVMDIKGQKMVAADYHPQAKLSQHLKDVRLMIAESQKLGLVLPFTQQHERVLIKAEQLGFGEQDNSAVIEALRSFRDRSGLRTNPKTASHRPARGERGRGEGSG